MKRPGFAIESVRRAVAVASVLLLAAPAAHSAESRTTFATRVVVPPKAEVSWGEVVGPTLGTDCAALVRLLNVHVEDGSPLLLTCSAKSSGDKSTGPRRHRLVVTLIRQDKTPSGPGGDPGSYSDSVTMTVEF